MSTSDHDEVSQMKVAGRSTGKYKDYVPRIEGQTEDFVLPPGATACPIKHCPRYMKVCHPHWRLNEHMKTRHGWPRKSTFRFMNEGHLQGAERLGKHSKTLTTSERPRRAVKSKRRSGSVSSGLSSPKSEIVSPQNNGSPQKGQRIRKPTSKKLNGLDGQLDVEMNDLEGADQVKDPAESYRDDQMISEIERFIDQLEANGTDNTSSERSKLIQGYKDLISDGMIKVNCILPEQQALRLMTLYKELSRRAEQQSSVYEMNGSCAPRHPPPPRPILKPRGRPSNAAKQAALRAQASAHQSSDSVSSASTIPAASISKDATTSKDAKTAPADLAPPFKKLKLKLNLSPQPKLRRLGVLEVYCD